MTADSSVLGKVGRVTGRVAHGSVGEVMVGVRGGSEAFFAYPYDAGETFDVGAEPARQEVELRAAADAARVRTEAAAAAEQRKLLAEAKGFATERTGEAEAKATRMRGEAEGAAINAKLTAEAEGIQKRPDAPRENQEAVINQSIAEQLPQIIEAAAGAYRGVDHMVVLNGAEGMGGITGQVLATGLSVIPMIREAFANGVNGGRAKTSENGEKPAAREPAKRTEPKQ